jgi:hypothetical protein
VVRSIWQFATSLVERAVAWAMPRGPDDGARRERQARRNSDVRLTPDSDRVGRQARRNSLRLIFNDVFVLQQFNNIRNSRGAFCSVGLSVLNAFKSPIHVTARFWNGLFQKNTDEGFALCIALPDSLRDNRLKDIGRYRLSFDWHRAVAEHGKLENSYCSLTSCASFL